MQTPVTFNLSEFVYAFEIMKQNMNDRETSVDKIIVANGNDLFIKNVDKVRRAFYSPDELLEFNKQLARKGSFYLMYVKIKCIKLLTIIFK